MRRILAAVCLLFLAALTVANSTYAQRNNMTPVEGSGLRARLENAISRGRAANSRFWAGYQFEVRPGVCVDAEVRSQSGGRTIVNGIAYNNGTRIETRNLGVFLLYDQTGNNLERVELYNLERDHSFDGLPVYWMDRVTNDESLGFLRGIVESNPAPRVGENCVAAVFTHDDSRVEGMIEGFARNSQSNKVRLSAVFWLGQLPGTHPYLAEVMRNEQEGTELRKQAAFSLGISSDPQAISTLQSVYAATNNREVKKQIIFASYVHNEGKEGADKARASEEGTNFLFHVAESDTDNELKKQALFWIGQRAGQRSLELLGKTVESNDADTDVQKQAVFAISQRPHEESIPLLIKIARTHAKPEVRKQAIFWLGQSGDPRALDFFKEVLSK